MNTNVILCFSNGIPMEFSRNISVQFPERCLVRDLGKGAGKSLKSPEKAWKSSVKVLKESGECPETILTKSSKNHKYVLRKFWQSPEKFWQSPEKVPEKSSKTLENILKKSSKITEKIPPTKNKYPEKVLRKLWESPEKVLSKAHNKFYKSSENILRNSLESP